MNAGPMNGQQAEVQGGSMSWFRRWEQLQAFLREELLHLTKVHASDRRWQMPFAAALASGLPLLIGAYFDRLDYGLVSSLGGLVFLYMPNTPMYHRMVWMMACGFGMTGCYAMGLISHFFTPVMMPVLVFIAILVTMVCRFYGVGPPGSLFFIMTASIGAYSPVDVLHLPLMVGLLTMGCLLSCLVGFFYSLYILRLQAPQPVLPMPSPSFDFVVFDSILIGVFVGISLAAAQLLQLQKAYWVPISCLAVIQGASLRAVWSKQLHRVLGTAVGLLVSWALLWLPLDKWTISLVMMALTLVIEFTVVRHYAIAVSFITPMTILLAEAATLGHGSPSELIQARFFDTVLGCFVGLVGGICLHSPRFRDVVGKPLKRLMLKPTVSR
jgi:uncharacterized membrane protein YgaE (UPF0421/DUF939 family)